MYNGIESYVVSKTILHRRIKWFGTFVIIGSNNGLSIFYFKTIISQKYNWKFCTQVTFNNTFCDNYCNCIYPNTLPIDKRFLPINNNNISLITLNTCVALPYGLIQIIYIPAQAFLQIINNNFAIMSTSSTMNQWVWSCGNNLLQVNNLAFSYII